MTGYMEFKSVQYGCSLNGRRALQVGSTMKIPQGLLTSWRDWLVSVSFCRRPGWPADRGAVSLPS